MTAAAPDLARPSAAPSAAPPVPPAAAPPAPRTDMGGAGRLGALAAILLLGGLGFWADQTRINGAVLAPGAVVAPGKPKTVQHLDGGIVAEILVEDGDRVEAGAPLVRLDATALRANLDIYLVRLAGALSLRDRLIAERDGAAALSFDDAPDLPEAALSAARRGQDAIFAARLEVQQGRRAQLQEKIAQYANQQAGVAALMAAKEEQLASLEEEIAAKRRLTEQGHLRLPDLLAIQRARADLVGQIQEHVSERARIANSVRDTELEISILGLERREDAAARLSEAQAEIDELRQQILATAKQLDRVEIRAPVAGSVHELQTVTIGGVVAPGGPIAQIVPSGGGFLFETRIDPTAADQVHPGQGARLRFSAFSQDAAPELNATVRWISADTVMDEATGAAFYRARLDVSEEELARLNGLELSPGMPVEAFLQTGERSVLSYLVKPLIDQAVRAFREE